jgi:shikimate kinase
MMGTGKSTIGKKIANKFNLKFYDSDKIIEEREGLSVLDIFDYKGEDYFRKIETQVIAELLGYGIIVLSTGGGSFLIDEVRNNIKNSALSVWLDSSPEAIHERVSRKKTRPLLVGENNNIENITQMVNDRAPIYSEADIRLETQDMESHFVVDIAHNRINKHFLTKA